MAVLYANNASSKLSASITNTATSFSVTAGQGALFPAITGSDYFYATLMDTSGNLEIVKVTARSVDTFTVMRGQDGTTARAYSVNDIVELRITKAMLDDLKSDARIGQLYGAASGAPDSWIWSVSPANPTWGIYYNEGTPDAIEFKAAGTTTASIFLDTGAANFAGALTQNGSQVLHAGNYSSYALPLSGGTVTGPIYLNSAGTARITWLPAGTGTPVIGAPFALNASTGAVAITVSDNDTGGIILDNEGATVYGAGDTGYVFRVIDEDVWQTNGNNVANATQFWVGQDSGASGFRNQLTIAGSTALHTGNYNSYAPTLTGGGASGTWGINVTGSAGTATSAVRIAFDDGPRDLSNRLPNSFLRAVNFDFVTAGVGNGTGNYAGVMTFSPWTGTTVSTGDSSYQLAFANGSGVNASGQPRLSIRNGIDGTWNAWHILLHSGNYNSYAPTLTGTGASGTWGISISGNASTASSSPLLSALGNYVWSASTLPTGYNQGVQASFVQGSNGFPSYGSVMTMNTYSGGGGALQMYVPYSPTYGGTALQVRFGNYDVSSGNSWTSWKTLLASDNYSSYALPLSGGTLTGIITTVSSGTAINFSGQSDSFGYNATSGLGTYIKGTGSTYIYGGGSFYDGSSQRALLHAGNYTSYSPSLTGSGASGTWGISITGSSASTTGNAATATTATNVSGGTASVSTLTVNSNNISAVNSLGFRNRIINGDMRVNQRNAGAVLGNNANGGVVTVDRWFCAAAGGAATFQQVTDGPTAGHKYSLRVTTSTAFTGTGTEGNHIFQWIERSNVLDFMYGTAQANSCTVSFWVKSSLTGSFAAFLYTNGGTANAARSIVTPFSINAANTWELKTITFVGDVTGSGYASIADNGQGLLFGIDLGSGTGRNTAAANAWAQTTAVRTSSTPGIMPTTGATLNLTGVQLEAGAVATPFERRPYGTELALCQRYYQGDILAAVGGGSTPTAANRNFYCAVNWPVQFRASPTLALITTLTNNLMNAGSWSSVDAARGRFTATNTTTNDAFLECVYSGSAEL